MSNGVLKVRNKESIEKVECDLHCLKGKIVVNCPSNGEVTLENCVKCSSFSHWGTRGNELTVYCQGVRKNAI